MNPYLALLRPKQAIKNGFVIAPIFFAIQFQNAQAWQLIVMAALAFACAAMCIYIINDIRDCEEDRIHPVKCKRPIAAGQISPAKACVIASMLASISFAVLTLLPPACTVIVLLYMSANLLYSWSLKHHALLDVFFIASCFVLRILMGCYVLSVVISPWILLTTFTLALFLGFGKRYHELSIERYAATKPNLQHYSRELLDKLVVICAGAAFVCYAIYTAEMANKKGDVAIVYTVVFVAFGLFRYLQSIYVYGKGGEPESVILKDKWQWVNGGLWLTTTLFILSTKY